MRVKFAIECQAPSVCGVQSLSQGWVAALTVCAPYYSRKFLDFQAYETAFGQGPFKVYQYTSVPSLNHY